MPEKRVFEGNYRRFENARERGLAARFAKILPVRFAFGQTD
jgi:hypothetical protein